MPANDELMTNVRQRKTPIALFVYNRPEHARLALESLSRCERLDECSLRIYCDGPNGGADAAGVATARAVAREWAERLGGEVVQRDTNLGLARSIVTGVTDLCEQYDRVIVLEDDFELSPSFLGYMLDALDRYAAETGVYQISGYMFPVEHAQRPDAFFLPLTTTWGWATWARAWRIFDWDAADAVEKLRDPKLRRSFDLDGSYPYSSMLEQRLRNENDSWGILLALIDQGLIAAILPGPCHSPASRLPNASTRASNCPVPQSQTLQLTRESKSSSRKNSTQLRLPDGSGAKLNNTRPQCDTSANPG